MSIYVGNLSYQVTQDALTGVFKEYGEVKRVQIPTDRETGRMRGFAFVEMASDDEALSAKDALDGAELDGRALRVSEARERAPRREGVFGDRPNRGGGGRPGGSRRNSFRE